MKGYNICTLYVTSEHAKVCLNNNRVVVIQEDSVKADIPIETLKSINVYGGAQITSPLLVECLSRGLPVQFHLHSGQYIGRISSYGSENLNRLRLQVHCTEDERFCLELSKKMVAAKIHNQRVVLHRYARNQTENTENIEKEILEAEKMISSCSSKAALTGIEGFAARIYFKGISRLVDDDFRFEGRSKRPPRDAFNSMLSFGYSILHNEIINIIDKHRLNSALGFLHEDKPGHDSLASDLMEEWRSIIVDSVVMSLINRHEISVEDFYLDDKGSVLFTKKGLRIFVNKLYNKMKCKAKYSVRLNEAADFRRSFDAQIMGLVYAMEQRQPAIYKAVRVR